jgi:hypothetical protein
MSFLFSFTFPSLILKARLGIFGPPGFGSISHLAQQRGQTRGYCGFLKEISTAVTDSQQCVHFATQILVAAARVLQKRGAFLKWDLKSLSEDGYLTVCIILHGILKPWAGLRQHRSVPKHRFGVSLRVRYSTSYRLSAQPVSTKPVYAQ